MFLKNPSIIILLLILVSCSTPIKKLYKSPDKYQGKKVCIKGSVVSSLELRNLSSFTMKDRTGKILIVTENLLPLKNDKIRVKGIFEKSFLYNDQNLVIIKERKLKERKLLDLKTKVNKL